MFNAIKLLHVYRYVFKMIIIILPRQKTELHVQNQMCDQINVFLITYDDQKDLIFVQ